MSIENYHLKWDSHMSYLNSSIATLYRNDKFSDCLLYSSNPDCGFPRIGIAAHKFILSSSSQFFASVFDSALSTTSGIFHIVLPPELTQRTIQILVQYMYSGEATVPNDILNEVLRGGELLKIRGLCRVAQVVPSNQEVHGDVQANYPKANHVENNNIARFPSVMHGIGASVHPEQSPVIVKPQNRAQTPQIGLLRIVNVNNMGGGITVNKEVAIDPSPPDDGKYCYPESLPQCLPNIRAYCRESGCTGCPDPADMECTTDLVHQQKLTMRTDLQRSHQSMEDKSGNEPSVAYRRVSLPTEALHSGGKAMETSLPEEPINRFQNIKEEPSDCWQVDTPNCVEPPTTPNIPKIVLKLKVPRETVPAPIKIETPTSGDDESSEPPLDSGDLRTYTQLNCGICKQTFNEPKNWVKHIESHMDKPKNPESPPIEYNQQPSKTPSFVPKKRRRASPENPGNHVTLMCDLCTRSFSTPAEWVRHINTQHTETELARFNSQRSAGQQKQDNELVRYSRRCHPKETFKGSTRSFRRSPTEIIRDPLEVCDVLTERFASNSQSDC